MVYRSAIWHTPFSQKIIGQDIGFDEVYADDNIGGQLYYSL